MKRLMLCAAMAASLSFAVPANASDRLDHKPPPLVGQVVGGTTPMWLSKATGRAVIAAKVRWMSDRLNEPNTPFTEPSRSCDRIASNKVDCDVEWRLYSEDIVCFDTFRAVRTRYGTIAIGYPYGTECES